MTLPASGNSLSLDQIHVEAGGTSGATCSLNDSDIRGLTAGSGYTIPTGDQSTIDIGDFYGASALNNTHTLEAGFQQTTYSGGRSGNPSTYTNYYGYMPFYGSPTSQNGSLTPTGFALKSGATISGIYKNTSSAVASLNNVIFLRVNGAQTNSGWTQMNLYYPGGGGNNAYNITLYRTAATQFVSGTTISWWKWSSTATVFINGTDTTVSFS
jgi:hypothetical protein